MSATWNLPNDIRRHLESIPDHDKVLAGTLEQGLAVLGFAAQREGPVRPLPARPFRAVFSGESPLPFLHPFSNAVTSIPLLENAAAGYGAMTFIPDSDGVVRRMPLTVRLQDQVMPTLAAESLRVAQGARNYIVKTSAQKGTGVQEIRIGGITAVVLFAAGWGARIAFTHYGLLLDPVTPALALLITFILCKEKGCRETASSILNTRAIASGKVH